MYFNCTFFDLHDFIKNLKIISIISIFGVRKIVIINSPYTYFIYNHILFK